MKAKSIKGNSPSEIKTALDESTADGFRPTLSTVFMSVNQECKAVCEISGNKGIEVFEATSCGLHHQTYRRRYRIGFIAELCTMPTDHNLLKT